MLYSLHHLNLSQNIGQSYKPCKIVETSCLRVIICLIIYKTHVHKMMFAASRPKQVYKLQPVLEFSVSTKWEMDQNNCTSEGVFISFCTLARGSDIGWLTCTCKYLPPMAWPTLCIMIIERVYVSSMSNKSAAALPSVNHRACNSLNMRLNTVSITRFPTSSELAPEKLDPICVTVPAQQTRNRKCSKGFEHHVLSRAQID